MIIAQYKIFVSKIVMLHLKKALEKLKFSMILYVNSNKIDHLIQKKEENNHDIQKGIQYIFNLQSAPC